MKVNTTPLTITVIANLILRSKAMLNYLSTQIGDTADYPAELNFDTEEDCAKFVELLDELKIAHDAYEAL